METLAINPLMPPNADVSQTTGMDADTGDGKSFMDALSGLMKNASSKEEQQDVAKSAESTSQPVEDALGQTDPAAGIAVLMPSIGQVTAMDSAREITATSATGTIVQSGMQPGLAANEIVSGDSRLDAGKITPWAMNTGLVNAGQSIEDNQSPAAVQSDERASSLLASPPPATQDRGTKSPSALQEARGTDTQAIREPGAQNALLSGISSQGMVTQFQSLSAQPAISNSALAGPITQQVGATGWSEAMGQRIVMMASEHVQQAEIRLNPEGLGPLQVVLSLEKGAADIQFLAHDAQVREALQAALPKLQDMLSNAGFSLDKVSIDAGSAKNQNPQGNAGQFQQARHDSGQDNEGSAPIPAPHIMTQARPGRIDTFA